jgi:hypothetical protein
MAISVTNIGQNNTTIGTTVSVTVPVGGVPAGALICVAVCDRTNSVPAGSVSDSAGNTYSAIVGANLNGATASGYGRIFYAWNVAALVSGNTITFTKASSNNGGLSAFYATGIDAAADPKDTAVTASSTSNSTTPSITSGTASVAGELFVAATPRAGAIGGPDSFTQDTGHGWAAPFNDVGGNGGADSRVSGGNQVNSGTGAITYAPTYGTAHSQCALICAFKPLASVTMPAAPGAFALTGIDALFNAGMTEAIADIAMTGLGSFFGIGMPEASAAYVLAGNAAPLRASLVLATGSYALTGNATVLRPAIVAATGIDAVTGIGSAFNVSDAAAPAAYGFAGVAANLNTTTALAAGAGAFAFAGAQVNLSYDIALGVPGDGISGGTFSRGRWRALRQEERRRHEDDLAAREREARRVLEIRLAADARAKAVLRAKWAEEDAVAADAAHQRLIGDAMNVFARLRGIGNSGPSPQRMAAAQAQREQIEEEEALALLLLNHE